MTIGTPSPASQSVALIKLPYIMIIIMTILLQKMSGKLIWPDVAWYSNHVVIVTRKTCYYEFQHSVTRASRDTMRAQVIVYDMNGRLTNEILTKSVVTLPLRKLSRAKQFLVCDLAVRLLTSYILNKYRPLVEYWQSNFSFDQSSSIGPRRLSQGLRLKHWAIILHLRD